MSPISFLLNCPGCNRDYDPAYYDLDVVWECLSCHEWFDCNWMLEDVAWVPRFAINYEAEFRREDPLTEHFYSSSYPRLCCDELYTYCKCSRTEEILEEDMKDFLLFNHIELSDVYDRETSSCISCEHYAGNGCVPLRDIVRFYDKTDRLPFFVLTRCKNFTAEDDFNAVDFKDKNLVGLVYDGGIDGYIAT